MGVSIGSGHETRHGWQWQPPHFEPEALAAGNAVSKIFNVVSLEWSIQAAFCSRQPIHIEPSNTIFPGEIVGLDKIPFWGTLFGKKIVNQMCDLKTQCQTQGALNLVYPLF